MDSMAVECFFLNVKTILLFLYNFKMLLKNDTRLIHFFFTVSHYKQWSDLMTWRALTPSILCTSTHVKTTTLWTLFEDSISAFSLLVVLEFLQKESYDRSMKYAPHTHQKPDNKRKPPMAGLWRRNFFVIWQITPNLCYLTSLSMEVDHFITMLELNGSFRSFRLLHYSTITNDSNEVQCLT